MLIKFLSFMVIPAYNYGAFVDLPDVQEQYMRLDNEVLDMFKEILECDQIDMDFLIYPQD